LENVKGKQFLMRIYKAPFQLAPKGRVVYIRRPDKKIGFNHGSFQIIFLSPDVEYPTSPLSYIEKAPSK